MALNLGIHNGLHDLTQVLRLGGADAGVVDLRAALRCRLLVLAGFADGGQHLAGDPFGELACLGFAAAKDEGVEAGFADDGELLFTARGTHILRTLFVLI